MTDVEMNRLRWSCRRGLLENELVLERFLRAHAGLLEGERLAAFRTLLEYSDDELWGLVSGRREWRSRARRSGPIDAELLAQIHRGNTMGPTKKATLSYGEGKSIEFPMLSGTVGPDVVDIRTLYAKTGIFTYDPGFMSTASCSSKITYIDGDAGVLLYRGYPIEQLAVHCDFLEVCYLLLNGELPDQKQKQEFVNIVTHHTMVHEQLARLYTGFRRDSHPMAVMVGVVGALSAFYHDSLDIANPQHREISAFR